ncbi:MAG: UDP-N-acetylmuramate:L-alanyl-gamma-D-glutamyl-meso-diaminopimelate ligase [Oligoflexales bacterium]|nr:UDP-N-acetylmuramate:L-alanyl-gamma-D-glutamyl-meso-diaminopimelate ligase [Oligoflexales bacterium]
MKKNIKHIYFMGIGGTGMGSVAGLVKEAGYEVTGSDLNIYPPMSTILEKQNIKVATPYSEKNLIDAKPDIVVVANVLSRGNEEIEYMLAHKIEYTSFPALLGELFLSRQTSIVVAGTHGKTTTSSLMAHILNQLGEKPGFLIGGLPRNFTSSFAVGLGNLFVVEGDEYDTAFFDKNSKFLHYCPKHLILNNIEYDHADIFKSIDEIDNQFCKLISLVPDPKNIVANIDDIGVERVLNRQSLKDKITGISCYGKTKDSPISIQFTEAIPDSLRWRVSIKTDKWGVLEFSTILQGPHNAANIAQCLGCLSSLTDSGSIKKTPDISSIKNALESFQGVARRLDFLGSWGGIDVFEDFAHHPTAVRYVLESFKKHYSTRRVLVAFDPRNATSRRNIFLDRYSEVLSIADKVFIGECLEDKRIPFEQRMNTNLLAKKIGISARAYEKNEMLLTDLLNEIKAGDSIIFMSSGSFSGIQYKLIEKLKDHRK